MSARGLRVVQLYPAEMNIYGDQGNALVLARRAGLYGFDVSVEAYEPGGDRRVLETADVMLGGGGQDSGQGQVVDDLMAVGPVLRERAAAGVPMLLVCGLYQLFGHEFRTGAGDVLAGIGVFDATTVAGTKRLIGNVVIDVPGLGHVVGYENHSGLTTLNAGQQPLGRVVAGDGNNGRDGGEGARVGNVVGTYLHGPVLPKNPALADQLLRGAAGLRYGDEVLTTADAAMAAELSRLDAVAERARAVAAGRPR
ncbi:MAG: glutamine amidotransferase [Propionibacteriaceae bacterium]|nr:glutamine amidotransferase [Propionibacteriaceae bacterium]